MIREKGTGSGDGTEVARIEEAYRCHTFMVQAFAGTVAVQGSLEDSGDNWSGNIQLTDLEAGANSLVLTTGGANKMYGFLGAYRRVRLVQVGSTEAEAAITGGGLS